MAALLLMAFGTGLPAIFPAAAAQELPPPVDPPGMRQIAGHRSQQVAQEADPDSLLALYPEIEALLRPGDQPFGRLHPDAPPQTGQYGRLAGVWYAETQALREGEWYCCGNALWAWRYVVGGFAVQDYWYQLEKDLLPGRAGGRDHSITHLRVFDPGAGRWSVTFVNNGGGGSEPVHGGFVSWQDDRGMVMRPPLPDDPEAPLTRVLFYDISPDHFRWRKEWSRDEGRTWEARMRIEAHRIPVTPPHPPRR